MANYQRVTPGARGLSTFCVKCERRISTSTGTIYADLDGRPYRDYYCPGCAGITYSTLPCGCEMPAGEPDGTPERLCATGNRLLDALLSENQRLVDAERIYARRAKGAVWLDYSKREQYLAALAYNAHLGRRDETSG